MRRLMSWIVLVTATVAAFASLERGALAATKSKEKVFGSAADYQALVYLIREKRLPGSARTMFVYADQMLLGTLENNSYTFAYLEPGEYVLWLNWAKVNTNVELEAGETYYFNAGFRLIDNVGEEWGTALIDKVKFFCTAEEKEVATAESHIRKRYPKAAHMAELKKEYVGPKKRREENVARWPKADLSAYEILCIAEVEMTDPKADKRKRDLQVAWAPDRLAKLIEKAVGEEVFERVARGPVEEPVEDAVVLQVDITRYKPGSREARGLLIGTSNAHLDFTVRLVDSATGDELSNFSGKRTWAWGGERGASFGIEEMEQNVAYEIALYLRQCRGRGGE